MSDVPGGASYELIMPLVAVEEHGGPFQADAYSAGLEAGSLMRLLWTVPSEVRVLQSTVRTANIPQLDLFAMHYGFVLTSEVWSENDFWSLVTFARPGDEVETIDE